MVVLILLLLLLAHIKPREDVKQETKEITDHVKERYGAYIQLYGKRYN